METIGAAKSQKCEFEDDEECLPLEINDFGSVINEPKNIKISRAVHLPRNMLPELLLQTCSHGRSTRRNLFA